MEQTFPVDQLQYSQASLKHLTEPFEADGGARLVAYQDIRGIWTIAFGHTAGVFAGMTCTQEQADQWALDDLAWAQKEVKRFIKVPITQSEYDALVDFVFNCGAGNFEHSTLLELVNQGNMVQAALEFDKWDHAGGKVVAGLLRRREAERQLFEGEGGNGEGDGTSTANS